MKLVWFNEKYINLRTRVQNMPESFKRFFYGFYAKEIYINLLDHISQIPNGAENRWKHRYSLVKEEMKLQYRDRGKQLDLAKLDLAKKFLLKSGFLREDDRKIDLFITEKGKEYSEDYYQFRMLGIMAKVAAILNKNFVSLASFLGIVVPFIVYLFTKVRNII